MIAAVFTFVTFVTVVTLQVDRGGCRRYTGCSTFEGYDHKPGLCDSVLLKLCTCVALEILELAEVTGAT